jgi:hypothetical protein
MLRFFYFGARLGLAALLSVSVSAQTATRAAARVQHIAMHETDAGLEVEIQTSGAPVAPDSQAITGPDRIVVDFPGALPASDLRALKVNRGALKGIRAGLFFDNPPITRVVLDLTGPQSYQISTGQNAVVVKLSSAKLSSAKLGSAQLSAVNSNPATPANKPTLVTAVGTQPASAPAQAVAELQNTSLAARASVVVPSAPAAAPRTTAPAQAIGAAPARVIPVQPPVSVSFIDGLLQIHAEKATLAQVLFEVQRQTRADIAIPAGAEQEEVAADLGPAPARDVLGELLNGSCYNFIFVGNELSLDQVILTRRDSNPF